MMKVMALYTKNMVFWLSGKMISTFQEYLEFRKLGFFLPFDELTQSYPLLNGDRVTMESLYSDYLEFMDNGADAPIRFFL